MIFGICFFGGIVLGLLTGVIFAIRSVHAYSSLDDEIGFGAVFGALLGAMAGVFLGLFVTLGFQVYWDKGNYGVTETQQLVCLKDGSSMSGRFFLGTGSIKEKQYYFYYRQEPDGSFQQHHIPIDGVRIYEENRTDGVLEISGSIDLKPHLYWLGNFGRGAVYKDYAFRIPKGSIQRQFVLDAE